MSRGTALVTGASSGIGEAFARLLAREGFDLILTARRKDRLDTLKDELEGEIAVHVISVDLAQTAGMVNLCQEIDNLGKPVDLLINNAAVMGENTFTALSSDEVQALIDINITALTLLTHYFLKRMTASGVGRILNVASMAAFHPVPGMDIYAASKAYVLSLTESLAEQLRGSGVSITALCPGLTDTEMTAEGLIQSVPPQFISQPELVAQEGYDALMRREVLCVPGNVNKVALTWAQHQPRWLVRGLGGFAARVGKIFVGTTTAEKQVSRKMGQ